MKIRLSAVLIVCALLSACIAAPAPTPQVIYVEVTPTPKPHVIQPTQKSAQPAANDADRLVAKATPLGWKTIVGDACPSGEVCLYKPSVCSYLMFHLAGSRVEGATYGVDFADNDCNDGDAQAQAQYDVLQALGYYDAIDWLGENVPDMDTWNGALFTSACGSWLCGLQLDSDNFLMLHIMF